MTDHPYTDHDLRAEAARQHATLTDDPDFMGVGEQMDGRYVHYEVDEARACLMPPPGTPRWDEVSEDDLDAAQSRIHALINGAADVSEWAVNLGADGLEPDEHTLQLGAKGPDPEDPEQPFVRLHFAFSPQATDEERGRFVMELSKVVFHNL
ncbi:hypothetical protein ACFCWT_13335 [Streptomyces olivaceus]|uniref:hypothetical protein n=1 Tax=Streptomyces olivaceus TaxID=47716 RepID=UPI0035DB6025